MDARTQQMILHAQVRRDAGVQRILASELAPGDIVLLEVGDRVPADCRLIECTNLRIHEAALTGESQPVDKSPSALDESRLPMCDRRTMAFMGTLVVAGRGLGVVTATGSHTQWGHIAALAQAVRRERRPRQHAEARRIVTALLLIIISLLLVLGILHSVLSMTMAATAEAGSTILSPTRLAFSRSGLA